MSNELDGRVFVIWHLVNQLDFMALKHLTENQSMEMALACEPVYKFGTMLIELKEKIESEKNTLTDTNYSLLNELYRICNDFYVNGLQKKGIFKKYYNCDFDTIRKCTSNLNAVYRKLYNIEL